MQPNFEKCGGLLPAIVQDARNGKVLMLGYMNKEAFQKTKSDQRVCFFSRSKNRLWVKGEESGNFLELKSLALDCDQDAILVQAIPCGPTCHLGTESCFSDAENPPSQHILFELEALLEERKLGDPKSSYTAKMLSGEPGKIAQKVGEEATEVVIAALSEGPERLVSEGADLLFHLLLLLKSQGVPLDSLLEELSHRRGNS